MFRVIKFLFALFFLVGWVCYADGAVQQKKMNVILILADDLGASDTFLGNSTFHQTPNLDRVAQRGMSFSNAYSASPLCSPTRASIMTGQSPARTGFTAPHGHMGPVVLEASEQPTAGKNLRQTVTTSVSRLSTKHISLAKALKQAGYATGHFGKWHIGSKPNGTAVRKLLLLRR